VLTKGGNRAASNDRVAAAAQRLGTIQPRPEVGTVTCSPDWVSLRVSNPGGPAVLWRVLVTVGDGVYYICTTAAAGCIDPDQQTRGFQHSSNAVTSTEMAPTGGSGQREGGATAGGLMG